MHGETTVPEECLQCEAGRSESSAESDLKNEYLPLNRWDLSFLIQRLTKFKKMIRTRVSLVQNPSIFESIHPGNSSL